jgi:hypothetical protein
MTSAQHHPDRDHSHPHPQTQPDPFALSELITAGDIDVVSGDPPVPIAVWRVWDAESTYGHTNTDVLSPRMAALLIGYYTRPGDTVVSVGNDPALAGAAGAGGRTYRWVQDPHDLPALDHVAGTVALIVLPWPPPQQPGGMGREQLTQVFRACQELMSSDGCTIVAISALPVGETYVEHSGPLIPAAHQAGLGWLQHIVAITAPISGQRITWPAPANSLTLRTASHIRVHIDLLVFTPRRGRHG